MNSPRPDSQAPTISVVIPSYNSAEWLPSTLGALAAAFARTDWRAEVVVVNDGSTDDTSAVLASLADAFPFDVRVVSQSNQGRFMARFNGAQAAAADLLLVLDSRMLINEGALAHLGEVIAADPATTSWNCHVMTDTAAPLVGHFWSVPTYLFWNGYLSAPHTMTITAENFDRLPKGTGGLVIPKELFIRACRASWPEGNAHLISDDTKILRYVVAETPLRLDPGYSAIYRPRESVRQFLEHAWDRGTLFIDSYAGTSGMRNFALVLLVVLPPLALVALIWLASTARWVWVLGLVIAAIAALLVPAVLASFRNCPPRAVLSYLAFVFPFSVVFWAGLARGANVHRRAFSRSCSAHGRTL